MISQRLRESVAVQMAQGLDRSSTLQKSIWPGIAAVLLTGTLLYAVAGFLLAPALLEREIVAGISERTGGSVAVGSVAVNPFNLTVELSDLSLDDAGQTSRLSVALTRAQIHIASLLAPGWIIRNLVVEAPRISIRDIGDVQGGYAQLAAALAQWAGGGNSLPVLDIRQLQISRGEVQLAAALAQWTGGGKDIPAATFDFAALDLGMRNLSTRPGQRAEFKLAATVNRSARLAAEGEFVPYPGVLDAALKLSALDVAEFGSAMGLASELELGSAQLAGEAKVHAADGRMSIRGDFALQHIEMVDRSSRGAVFSAAEVSATAVTIETSPPQLSMGQVRLRSPYLRLTRDANGTLHGLDWPFPRRGGPASRDLATQRIEIEDGRLDFKDLGLTPAVQMDITDILGTIAQRDPAAPITLTLRGRLMAAAEVDVTASWQTAERHPSSRVDLLIKDLDAAQLSPYFAALAGRDIASGKLDLEIGYRQRNKLFELTNEISASGFRLAEPGESPDSGNLPLDLAIALLADGNGRLNVSIPLPGGRSDQGFLPPDGLRHAFSEFVTAIADAPFAALARVAGWSGPDLGRVAFQSGSAALAAASSVQLGVLAIALEQRPGLSLDVSGAYNRTADRDALARQQVRLHIALASSSGPPGQAAATPLVFTDPKVISVLNEFAATRLRSEILAVIGARNPGQGPAYYDAVFEALVANENVSTNALNALARFRAQSIVDQLAADGIDANRLRIGPGIEAAEMRDRAVLVELRVAL